MEERERDTSPPEDDDSSNDDTSESETELMVTTRTRRATAGNRYSTLVAQEEAAQDEEDEVAMLFAEGEGEDEDFNSDEGDDDADMSSTDDDDQGPNAAAGDLEGETAVQNEEKLERAKKRKADLALTTMAGLKKKPRIDPTSLRRAPASKPSKRKERVSWLPGSNAAPGRTSLRKQTILHRAETHAKLKENEEQRLKLKARREKREREREAEAPKELTQADRLAEAERVERRNAKSLNRWEAMEKKRAEEQAAKLAALKDRKLEGAVVTWYSSSAKYFGLKENKSIENEAPVEHKKRGRKPKALLEQLAAAKLANSEPLKIAPAAQVPPATSTNAQSQALSQPVTQATDRESQQTSVDTSQPSEADLVSATQPVDRPKEDTTTEHESVQVDDQGSPFLTGIHEYASMPSEYKAKEAHGESETAPVVVAQDASETGNETSVVQESTISESASTANQDPPKDKSRSPVDTNPANELQVTTMTKTNGEDVIEESPAKSHPTQDSSTANDVPTLDAATVVQPKTEIGPPTAAAIQSGIDTSTSTQTATVMTETPQTLPQPTSNDATSSAAIATPSEPPIEVISTRNLVVLDKFEELSEEARHEFGLFYNNRKTAKPVKHSQELCPVTGLAARYRDPASGIAYANTTAYKKLQELNKHQFTWSSMLGCYIGGHASSTVARGVPDGFLN